MRVVLKNKTADIMRANISTKYQTAPGSSSMLSRNIPLKMKANADISRTLNNNDDIQKLNIIEN